ncbi:vWA domain-containing protein [Cellulosimicrobium protaetiae]|uniref:VWA domain-containing protein n=1 Tax=Cellulosimicrobium protaetiae TaxID=2587808 RepID=A0A6M5UE35_9MICO|nr:VWA domain-containing protein [Cellulosimicrobium protaetiae]QJW35483.1 VWA domain-containing protein [Cellulosimicrobium protaetiae]
MAQLNIETEDLVENPTPRVPVAICIDTSGSMSGDPIRELVAGVNQFYDAIDEDDDAHDAAEVCIVEFNSGAKVIQEFASVERLQRITTIAPTGRTYMGEGVNLALDTLDARKRLYSDNGVLYYQPWLVLMTDGGPNGDRAALDRAVQRVTDLAGNKKLTVFAIGIGAGADMDVLARFSPTRPPLRLQGLHFKEFFEWLSKSVARVSQSSPGDTVKLDLAGLAGWAEL